MQVGFNKAMGAVFRIKLAHQPMVVGGEALQP
jgi:hypothetical protein